MVISGTGFKDPPTDITFRGVSSTAQVFVSSTTLRCTTPALSAGLADVEVTQSDGSALLSNGWEFEVATVKSAEYTLVSATPLTLQDQRKWGGTVHAKTANYTITSLGATDVIEMVDLKAGDVVVGVTLSHTALLTSTTLAVGITTTDADVFIAATAATSAAIIRTGVTSAGANLGYTMLADDTIDIVSAGATATNTSGLIQLTVYYIPMGA